MKANFWIYLTVAFLTTFAIRLLPMLIFRKPIRNRFVRSFLYYVPYVTLSVMTFPAIIFETGNIWIGMAAMAAGVVTAWKWNNLFVTASIVCGVTLILSLILQFLK